MTTTERVMCLRGSNFLTIIINLYLVSMLSSNCYCNEFKSVPTTVKTHENDSVLLPCYLDSAGTEETGGTAELIKWFKDGELVIDNSTLNNSARNNKIIQDPASISSRAKLWSNGSLEVMDVQDSDTGEYMCEVIRKPPWNTVRQVHAIEVLYPPSIEAYPNSGSLQVKLGEEVEMSCETSGVPHPLMTWTSKGTEMQLLDNRQKLKFPATDRHLSGIYECIASNGVGNPARAKIELSIIYPPEVTVTKIWLHASPGLRATLECIVTADPTAEVHWYKSNMIVPLNSRVVSIVEGDVHSLIIRSVQVSDFGIYTCRAVNDLGLAEADIQLSGVANPGIFKEVEQKNTDKKAYTLVWEVDSYTPIIEYNLWFRPFQIYNIIKKPDWTKLTIPAEHSSGPMHSKAYSITGLKENTVYEAMLFSRNRYGWSKPSKIFRFSIDGTELKEEVVTQIQENIIPLEIVPVEMISNAKMNSFNVLTLLITFILTFIRN